MNKVDASSCVSTSSLGVKFLANGNVYFVLRTFFSLCVRCVLVSRWACIILKKKRMTFRLVHPHWNRGPGQQSSRDTGWSTRHLWTGSDRRASRRATTQRNGKQVTDLSAAGAARRTFRAKVYVVRRTYVQCSRRAARCAALRGEVYARLAGGLPAGECSRAGPRTGGGPVPVVTQLQSLRARSAVT
jgi:hypothetical protein